MTTELSNRTYNYRIAGRTPGVVDQELYQGQVHTCSRKDAIIEALAKEFGDDGEADPFTALTSDGWIDYDLLDGQFSILDNDATSFELQAEEHSYAVEVREATEATPDPDKVKYSRDLPAQDQVDAEEWIAACIYDHPGTQPGSGQTNEEIANQLGKDILYEVLRRFRPDLFADNPALNKLVLQICSLEDRYWLVSKDVLKRSLDIPHPERFRWLYGQDDGQKRITATTIHSDNDVDIVLICDNDDWDDYEEAVRAILDEEVPNA